MVEHIGGRKRARRRLAFEDPPEGHGAGAEHGLVAIEVGGHRPHVAVQVVALFLQIGARHRGGVLHHDPHPLGEPVLDPPRDQGPEEQGHHDGRDQGGQGEHGHEPHMQSHAGVAAALAQHVQETPADGGGQAKDQDQIAEDCGQDDAAGRTGPAGAGRTGREIDGGDRQQDRDSVSEAQHETRLQPPAPGDPIRQTPGRDGHGRTLRRLCPKLNRAVATMLQASSPNYAFVRTGWMPRSWIFLRRVLRFRPRISAARI